MSGQISENAILTGLSELVSQPVHSKSLQRARLHLLDWVGCAAAGSREPAGQILLGDVAGGTLSRAFVWGGLGNILEMDDVDKRALLHPGPTIVPAALSLALEKSASMPALLESLVRGYEATIRLGRSVGAGHYAMFHSTGTCGAIGAAVAGASLLGLDKAATAHAMALAVSQSAGFWHTRHDPGSMAKQLHTAVAARAGIHAAKLAAGGFTGPLAILEGPQGFFEAVCPGADPKEVLATSDADWSIFDVSFKPWPACRHAHAVIDAALALRPKLDGIVPDKVSVRTYADALKFCDRPNPRTVIEAKFSLQHAVAVVLARGEPQLEDFDLHAIAAKDIRVRREAVSVSASDVYESVYPAHFGAEIECGGVIVRVPDALGDPENPVSDQQIRDKARMLLQAGGISDATADMLIKMALNDDIDAHALSAKLSEVLQ